MGLGKIRFIRPFLLIFGVHLNSQEFLGSKCKIFSLGAGDFLWLHCTIKVTTSLPPPPTGNIKKNNQEKNRTKINPLLYDSLPSCCISIYYLPWQLKILKLPAPYFFPKTHNTPLPPSLVHFKNQKVGLLDLLIN